MKSTQHTVGSNPWDYDCMWCDKRPHIGDTVLEADCDLRKHLGSTFFCSLDCNKKDLENYKQHKIEYAKETYQKREAKYWWFPNRS